MFSGGETLIEKKIKKKRVKKTNAGDLLAEEGAGVEAVAEQPGVSSKRLCEGGIWDNGKVSTGRLYAWNNDTCLHTTAASDTVGLTSLMPGCLHAAYGSMQARQMAG